MDRSRQLFEILKAVEETQKKVAALADVILSTIPSTGTAHLFDMQPQEGNALTTDSSGPTIVFPASTFAVVSNTPECMALRQEVKGLKERNTRLEREVTTLRLQLHMGHGLRDWELRDLGENGHH